MSDLDVVYTGLTIAGILVIVFVLVFVLLITMLIFFFFTPPSPVPPTGFISPSNQNLVGSSTDGSVFFQNGDDFNNGTLAGCQSSPTQIWDTSTGTCQCINGFYNEKCNFEAYNSNYIDAGQVTVGDTTQTVTIPSSTSTVSSTADFLSFNPTGNGRDTFRTFTKSCTDQCDLNSKCTGVIFNNFSISPITVPTIQNTCTLLLGPIQMNSSPALNTEGPVVQGAGIVPVDNLFMKISNYSTNMMFVNSVYLSGVAGNISAFPIRYWLAPASAFFTPINISPNPTFDTTLPTTPVTTIPYSPVQFIDTNSNVGVFYKDAVSFDLNKSLTLTQIYAIYTTSGQSGLITQGMYLFLPWNMDFNLLQLNGFGSATSPTFARFVYRPTYIPPP